MIYYDYGLKPSLTRRKRRAQDKAIRKGDWKLAVVYGATLALAVTGLAAIVVLMGGK